MEGECPVCAAVEKEELKIVGVNNLYIKKDIITADREPYSKMQLSVIDRLPHFHSISFKTCNGSLVNVTKQNIRDILERMDNKEIYKYNKQRF